MATTAKRSTKQAPKRKATKKKQPAKAKSNGKPADQVDRLGGNWAKLFAAREGVDPKVGEARDIAIGELHPSPTNPRKHFDPSALKKMAESIQNVGVLESLVVRPRSGKAGYEIIAGERRYRASKLAKLSTLPCSVRMLTDAEVLEVQLVENLEREDLNPIEEAIAFQQLTAEGGMTQQQLADRLGVSQGHIANRIRLLDLDEPWRGRIISREIPPTHARHLVPWAKYPTVLKAFEKIYKSHGFAKQAPHVDLFKREICFAAMEGTKPLSDSVWEGFTHVDVKLNPTAEEQEKLQIIDVPRPWGGKPEKRCLNAKLWNKLWGPAKKAALKRQRSSPSKSNGATVKKKLSPAEQKKKDAEAEAAWRKKLYRWKIAWLQKQIAAKLDQADTELLLKLLLFFSVQDSSQRERHHLSKPVESHGGKWKKQKGGLTYFSEVDAYATLSTLPPGEKPLRAVAIDVVKEWVQINVETYRSHLRPNQVEALAGDLDVDIKRDWRLTEDYLELHTKAQLEALAFEWDVSKALTNQRASKRSEIIDALVSVKDLAKCPVELARLKPVKL